jgi:hypothetical protein
VSIRGYFSKPKGVRGKKRLGNTDLNNTEDKIIASLCKAAVMEASSDTKHVCAGNLDTGTKNKASLSFQTAYYNQNQEGSGLDTGISDRRRDSWGIHRTEIRRVISNVNVCKHLLIGS